jgi:putative transposase
MRKSTFTDNQIIAVLQRAEAGEAVPASCRDTGVRTATFYKWRARFGGMAVPMMARMKKLADENRRLKKMYLDEKLKAEVVAEAIAEKWQVHLSGVRWPLEWSPRRGCRSCWPARRLGSTRVVLRGHGGPQAAVRFRTGCALLLCLRPPPASRSLTAAFGSTIHFKCR